MHGACSHQQRIQKKAGLIWSGGEKERNRKDTNHQGDEDRRGMSEREAQVQMAGHGDERFKHMDDEGGTG